MKNYMIVDDEPPARRELIRMVTETVPMSLCGEAGTVTEAAALLRDVTPDVLFLDVQLGSASGFDVIPFVAPSTRIIFVTAYDSYAVRAFEVNALDYVMKPVLEERLRTAIQRTEAGRGQPIDTLSMDDPVFFKGSTSGFIKVKDIVWIRSAGDFSQVRVCSGETFHLSIALATWENRLPENSFFRVHRSCIIHIPFVRRIVRGKQYVVHFLDGSSPQPISRRSAARLLREKGIPSLIK